mgnify:CR=1 FL=1
MTETRAASLIIYREQYGDFNHIDDLINVKNIGSVTLTDGEFEFPILSKNDRVSITVNNSTPYPSAFQSAEWTGYYTTKSGRI